LKRRKILEKITENETKEKGAYISATTMLETVQNAAIKTGFVSVHAKLKTELAMVDTQIKDYQQLFGLEMYQIFADLEDMEGWLPTVRDIRSIYDQARRDVDKIELRRKEKEKELEKLGGVPMTTTSECSKYSGPSVASQDERKKNEVAEEYFRQADPTLARSSLGAQRVGENSPLPSTISVSSIPYSERQSGTSVVVQTQAAPISAPLQYGSSSVPYNDPFGSSNFASVPAQPVISGAAFDFMSEGSQRSFGSGPAMGIGLGPAQPVANGTSNFGLISDDSQRSHGSGPMMGPVMGVGGNLMLQDAFAPTPAISNYNDPFAAFDSLQQTPPQRTQADNPLFRY
jgi:hypothetical protein